MNRGNLENFRKRKAPTKRHRPLEVHFGIAEHLEDICDHMHARGYAPTTVTRFRCCIDDFAKFLLRHRLRDLRAVQPDDIERYQAELRSRSLSWSTRAQNIGAVGRLYDHLVDRGLLLLNPVASVKRIKRQRALPKRVPTRDEVQRLLNGPDTDRRSGIRNRAILETLYGSAIRVEELVGLQVDDVALQDRQLRIEHGKGNKGRVVPVTEACCQWLRIYLDEVRAWWTRRRQQCRQVFLTQNARPMRQAVVRDIMWDLCRALKLPPISPHGLRHAAATHMVAAGADIRYVQKLLGHKDISTTQIYARVVPNDIKATHQACHPRERLL